MTKKKKNLHSSGLNFELKKLKVKKYIFMKQV